MAEGYLLSEDAVKRTKRAVLAYERVGVYGAAELGDANPSAQCITAKLTSRDGAAYGWEQVVRTPTGWETVDDGLYGETDDRPALDLDETGASDFLEKVVILVRGAVRDEEGKLSPGWFIASAVSLPVGQYQYMVFQMVSQNVSGFDFVRAHPML